MTAAPTSPTRRAPSGIPAMIVGAVDDAHAAVGRAPHHAVRAAARAAARRLGHEHVGELGVRRRDHRARGQQRVVGLRRPAARARRASAAGSSPARPASARRAGARDRSRRRARACTSSTISSSPSPTMITSQNGASGAGFENVSGPPATTSGWCVVALVGAAPGCSRARASRSRPAISSSYATEYASIG